MGSLTPPVGLLVYISSGIADVPATKVFKEILPMLFAAFIALLIITYFPPLSLWLPELLF
jgi:C4-dicarboxylate transporter DctM subunit